MQTGEVFLRSQPAELIVMRQRGPPLIRYGCFGRQTSGPTTRTVHYRSLNLALLSSSLLPTPTTVVSSPLSPLHLVTYPLLRIYRTRAPRDGPARSPTAALHPQRASPRMRVSLPADVSRSLFATFVYDLQPSFAPYTGRRNGMRGSSTSNARRSLCIHHLRTSFPPWAAIPRLLSHFALAIGRVCSTADSHPYCRSAACIPTTCVICRNSLRPCSVNARWLCLMS